MNLHSWNNTHYVELSFHASLQVPGEFSDSLGKIPARNQADGTMRLLLRSPQKLLFYEAISGRKCDRPAVISDHSSQCWHPTPFYPGTAQVPFCLLHWSMISLINHIFLHLVLIICAPSDCDDTGQPDFYPFWNLGVLLHWNVTETRCMFVIVVHDQVPILKQSTIYMHIMNHDFVHIVCSLSTKDVVFLWNRHSMIWDHYPLFDM